MEQYMAAILVIFKIHNKTQTVTLTVLVEEEVKKLRTKWNDFLKVIRQLFKIF